MGFALPCLWRGRAVQAAVTAAAGVVPWVAMSGSQLWPVVMTACRCRRIAAAMTAWAWMGVSLLLVARVVRWR